MRAEPYLLKIENYPFKTEIPTRYGDVDSNGHVNNVAVARLFEESRMQFAVFSRAKPFTELRAQTRVVTISVLVNYLSEVFYPQPATIGVGVIDIGRTSYTLGCLMLQEGKPVAVSKATLVRSEDGSSSPLPEDMIELISKCKIRR